MRRLLLALCLLLVSPVSLLAQSSPGLVYGQVPSAADWNSYFEAKMDYWTAGLPVSHGGTGSTTAAGARTNLGLDLTQPWIFLNSQQSTSFGTGAVTLTGGLGVGGNIFTNGALTTANNITAGGSLVSFGPIAQGDLGGAPTVASATTIAVTTPIVFISGTTNISTISVPSPINTNGGSVTLIPTGLWHTITGGNIALGTTAVVSRALTLTYDPGTALWYPSY